MTHEFLSEMLGVRRAGISEAASALQASGAIEYGQESVRIVDLEALIGIACECFGVIRDEYDRLLGKQPI